jgi:hypothetical protein
VVVGTGAGVDVGDGDGEGVGVGWGPTTTRAPPMAAGCPKPPPCTLFVARTPRNAGKTR